MSLPRRKAAAILPILLMSGCVVAYSLFADDSSTAGSGQKTPSQKPASSTRAAVTHPPASKTQTRTGPPPTAPHQRVPGTAAGKTTTPSAAKGPNTATKNTSRPSTASLPAQARTTKPAATHTAATTSAHKRAATSRTRSTRRRRPLTFQQRLARLHLQPERVSEIQQALIRERYLQGEPNGLWDSRTHDAMLRYQTEHGFPATGLPEAKSLMKLGLGSHPLPPELDPSLTGVAGSSAARGDPTVAPPVPHAATPVSPSRQ